jgi:uncharacterized protein
MFGDIRNAQGEKLNYRWHPATTPLNPQHIVIIGHGVTAHLDRPFVAALAEGLAAAGLSALRFSFSGNGTSEGRFQDSCITKEVADLGAVIDTLTAAGHSVSYVGHSMGGAVGVLRSGQDARIQAFVSLAGMVETARFAETEFGMVTPDEGCMWDEPDCPLSSTFMNDLRSIGSVESAITAVKCPVLFVYGADDDLVLPQEGRAIFAAANEPKHHVELEGSNHVFSGDATPRMVFVVTEWLKGRV